VGSQALTIDLEVPEGISDTAKETAASRAREAFILSLWEQAELTIREAAQELGLTYRDFLDLLAARGIPVERGELNLEVIDQAAGKTDASSP
jgi:predicted transcriptional regulator